MHDPCKGIGCFVNIFIITGMMGIMALPVQGEERVSDRGILIGSGIGIPIPWPDFLNRYVQAEVQRDFRLYPSPGYYPYLQDRTLASDMHFFIGVVLDGLELRYDYQSFGWDQAIVTHVSKTQVEMVNGAFDDATAQYISIDDPEAAEIRDEMGEDLVRDISEFNLARLQLHALLVGYRMPIWEIQNLHFWWEPMGGLILATFSQPGADWEFGFTGRLSMGLSYRVSPILSFEFEGAYRMLVTTAPGDLQSRENHAEVLDQNLLELFFEAIHYSELNVGLKIHI